MLTTNTVSPVLGYNVVLSLDGKPVLGRTQEDLTIAAKIKESITKDDAGERQRTVTGHDITFKVSALMRVDSSTTATKLDHDAVIALALEVGDDAVIPFTYASGGTTLSGNLIITGYSESSSGDPETDSTISLDCQTTGEVTLT